MYYSTLGICRLLSISSTLKCYSFRCTFTLRVWVWLWKTLQEKNFDRLGKKLKNKEFKFWNLWKFSDRNRIFRIPIGISQKFTRLWWIRKNVWVQILLGILFFTYFCDFLFYSFFWYWFFFQINVTKILKTWCNKNIFCKFWTNRA
jgi:hypothetical protein